MGRATVAFTVVCYREEGQYRTADIAAAVARGDVNGVLYENQTVSCYPLDGYLLPDRCYDSSGWWIAFHWCRFFGRRVGLVAIELHNFHHGGSDRPG